MKKCHKSVSDLQTHVSFSPKSWSKVCNFTIIIIRRRNFYKGHRTNGCVEHSPAPLVLFWALIELVSLSRICDAIVHIKQKNQMQVQSLIYISHMYHLSIDLGSSSKQLTHWTCLKGHFVLFFLCVCGVCFLR